MKQDMIRLNRTYRLKPEVFTGSMQADGQPLDSPDVTIVRQKFPNGRKLAWFYDARGNAFRASDFADFTPIIEVEL